MPVRRKKTAIIHEHHHVTDAGMRYMLETLSSGIARYLKPTPQYLWYSPQKFQDRTTPGELFSSTNIDLIEDRELGYLTSSFDSVKEFETAIERRKHLKLRTIKERLRKHGAVVHILQNPTLLKNPVETQANARLAAELLDEQYLQIWHIHDLLEDSPARQPLRDFIKTVAGTKTEEIYGHNGSGIAWTTSPNIIYAMINLKDRGALQKFLGTEFENTIFYFPDPVDIESIRVTPFFKRDGVTIDDRISAYCRSNDKIGYSYNADAELILATEFARERKNTGEQILLLKLLNSFFSNKGRKFQLLVTLVPTAGKDAQRITIFQEYIRKNRLPAVMGFGSQVIARGGDIGRGQFTMTDLWNHPRARMVLSTSVKEGFGLNFINPAIATSDNRYTLATVGRRLSDIFPDFKAMGMVIDDDAFYDAIRIDASILLSDGGFLDEQRQNVVLDKLPRRYSTLTYDGVIPLGRDFGRYSAQEQVVLMDLVDYRKLSDTLSNFLSFVSDAGRMNQISKANSKAIMEHLSLETYMKKLETMIGYGFANRKARLSKGETPEMIMDNKTLCDFYKQLEGQGLAP